MGEGQMTEPGSEPSGQPDREPDGESAVGRAKVRNVGRVRRGADRVRGAAPPPDPSTRFLQRPDVTAPIFVDGSGRRGRRLRRVAYWIIAVVLVLLALWWVSQASIAAELH
jgi:hypothetical protein